MNWVLTAARTETRWRSMQRIKASASKSGSSTHGAPRRVGVTCAVQIPKPKGAGNALMKTSPAWSLPDSSAKRWKWIQRAWSWITHLGSPVVPEVEFSRKGSSGPRRRSGGAGCRGRGQGLPLELEGGVDAELAANPQVPQLDAAGAQVRDQGGHVDAAVHRGREQQRGTGPAHQMLDLGLAGAGSDARDDQPRLLAGEEGDVHSGTVREHDGHPGTGGQAARGELSGQRVGGLGVVRPAERSLPGVERDRVGPGAGRDCRRGGRGSARSLGGSERAAGPSCLTPGPGFESEASVP